MADWGDGVSASCTYRGSNCPLARAMDGHALYVAPLARANQLPKALLVKSLTHVG